MLMTLILAATIGQAPEWHSISNYPEWQGFGCVRSNGIITPQRWRQAANPGVEFIRDGDPVPDGYVRTAQDRVRAIDKPIQSGGDHYGFVAWINGVRATRGLGAVAWSNEMAYWALENSKVGFGHLVLGTARRQNAGSGSLWTICNAWLAHGPHAAALLDPSILEVGLGVVGQTWTFSAR